MPQLGDLFEHDGRGYRVTGFIKTVTEEAPMSDRSVAMLVKMGLIPASRKVQVFCHADEAEQVCGYGVAGVILPVAEVQVTGRVNWSEQLLADETASYEFLVGQTIF